MEKMKSDKKHFSIEFKTSNPLPLLPVSFFFFYQIA